MDDLLGFTYQQYLTMVISQFATLNNQIVVRI